MTTKSTRRAILAGAATLPALSLPTIACADPIFEAIENHRTLYLTDLTASHARFHEPDIGPAVNWARLEELEAARDAAIDTYRKATDRLSKTRPTTKAGLNALISYIESFNSGGVALDSDPLEWGSYPGLWLMSHPSPGPQEEGDIAAAFAFAMLSTLKE